MEPENDVSALGTYAGTYSRQLIAQVLNGLDIAKDLKVIYNLLAPLNLSKLIVNSGIRPLDTSVTTAFSPGRTWSLRTITPRVGMKIFNVVPEELRVTWMSEMLSPNAVDVPFADWVWAQEFAKLQEEINDTVANMVYNGDAADYNPATVYHAGDVVVYGPNRYIYSVTGTTTAGYTPVSNPSLFTDITLISICDGPMTILAAAINDSSIASGQIIATGATDSTNAVANCYAVWNGAPEVIKQKKTIMFVAPNIYRAYLKNYEALHPYFSYNKTPDMLYLDLSNNKCEIRPCTWMGTSGRMVLTLPDNWLMGTNLTSDVNGIGKQVPTLHGFIAICKFILAFQFADTEVVYINDQE